MTSLRCEFQLLILLHRCIQISLSLDSLLDLELLASNRLFLLLNDSSEICAEVLVSLDIEWLHSSDLLYLLLKRVDHLILLGQVKGERPDLG